MLWLFVNSSDNIKDINIEYFSGYNPSFSILAYDSSTQKKCLFVIPFELGQYKKINNIVFDSKKFKSDLLKHFGKKSIRKIGINKKTLSLSWYERLKDIFKFEDRQFIDIGDKIAKLRLIKNILEINKISVACSYGDKVFSELILKIKNKGLKTEREVYDYINLRGIELGLKVSFDPVVASGKNAALPHHIADETKLSNFVVIDMGYIYKGYCSDMTRTIFVGNSKIKISNEDIKRWNLVKEMHDYAIKRIKKGISEGRSVFFNDIDNVIRANLGDNYCHSLGHGVGVEIHEQPTLSFKIKNKLADGMVFTIEPGIYIKGEYGIRHENLFVYKENKLSQLTNSKDNLIVING